MDDALKEFLEKFAELERRVRKLAAENRSLRDEADGLREKLMEARSRAEELEDRLSRERQARHDARDRVDDVIERLEGLKSGNAERMQKKAEVGYGGGA